MKNKLLLVAIVLVAFLFRFYQLGSIPPSLDWDEAAWGYNAYSLSVDARDEFGRFLPVNYFESFGDFKPPVYAYLAVLPVKLFGLTNFAVRIPSAFFGVLSVLLTYFLVKKIFASSVRKEMYALLSAFLLAVSPWHIMLSRAAFEANIATFLLISGVWLFLWGTAEKKWCLPLSIASFVISLYTYNAARVVAPLLVIVLAIAYRKVLLQRKRYTFIAIITGLILIIPTFSFLLSPQASLRFREVNIFSDASVVQLSNQESQRSGDTVIAKFIHNRRFIFAVDYIWHYFDNLTPSFLFIKGDGNPKFSVQDVGQMYLLSMPFFIVGILFLFRKKEGSWWIVPTWLLLGIIPAAVARETPHALRTEVTLPTFQIFTAYGFAIAYTFYKENKKKIIYTMFFLVIGIGFVIEIIYFGHTYFVNYAQSYSGEWQYGYEKSIQYVRDNQNKYDNIYITNKLGRPYIYYLFYLHVNPQHFRAVATVHRDPFGFVTVTHFDKYYFSQNVNLLPRKGRVLYINAPESVPNSVHILQTFYLLNGEKALVAYTL